MPVGPCAKRRVRCTIVTVSGRTFVGENTCATPQTRCPRTAKEDVDRNYTKCKTVCGQFGHAEKMAAMIKAFAGNTEYGTAFIQGHHYACDSCQAELQRVGVGEVFFGEPRIDATHSG
jgi:deoxycytidylate deaminase